MKLEEAIEILNEVKDLDDSMYAYNPTYMDAMDMAIEALEKQKVKEIKIREWDPAYCPTCKYELSYHVGDGFYKHLTFLKRCPKCGQAIQWN